jgi:hypothetical protein
MTAWNAADHIHGVQLEPGAGKSCPGSPGWATASVDAVTDVVLVLDRGSSRYTLACIRRGGLR